MAPGLPCLHHPLQHLGWATPCLLARVLLTGWQGWQGQAWGSPRCPPRAASCSRLPLSWLLHRPTPLPQAASSAARWGWAWQLTPLPSLHLRLLLLLLLRGSLLHAHWRRQLLLGPAGWSGPPQRAPHHHLLLLLLLLPWALRPHCCCRPHCLLLLPRRLLLLRPLLRGAGGWGAPFRRRWSAR
jgi:hypothetical protein